MDSSPLERVFHTHAAYRQPTRLLRECENSAFTNQKSHFDQCSDFEYSDSDFSGINVWVAEGLGDCTSTLAQFEGPDEQVVLWRVQTLTNDYVSQWGTILFLNSLVNTQNRVYFVGDNCLSCLLLKTAKMMKESRKDYSVRYPDQPRRFFFIF